MNLEELFEDNGNIVDSDGIPVSVERVGTPRIVLYGDEKFELGGINKKSPKGADAFVKGEKETVRKRVERAVKFWPPLAPVYDTLHYLAVQYFKKY